MPCLASRIPYGTAVTVPLLRRIDRAESAVRGLGFRDVRVRDHGDQARVEVPIADLATALENGPAISDLVTAAGYRHVTIDPTGLVRVASTIPSDPTRWFMADRLAIWKRALETTQESPDTEPRLGGERHRPLVADLGHTRLDLDRLRRTGVPEAVYAEGKAPYQVVEIVSRLLTDTDHPIVLTRTTEAQRDALAGALLTPDGMWSDTLTWRHADLLPVPPVAVVSGGTSDQAVVDECVGTLTAYGIPARGVRDVGVAGLHRLLDAIDGFSQASVLIAVAGMEAALATVLAGLVPNPVIAVPTSVGYGATFEGVTAAAVAHELRVRPVSRSSASTTGSAPPARPAASSQPEHDRARRRRPCRPNLPSTMPPMRWSTGWRRHGRRSGREPSSEPVAGRSRTRTRGRPEAEVEPHPARGRTRGDAADPARS